MHRAVNARSAANGLRDGVVLVGAIDACVDRARALRTAGTTVVAASTEAEALALATADGWRYVAVTSGAGMTVLDRSTGERVETSNVAEVITSRAL